MDVHLRRAATIAVAGVIGAAAALAAPGAASADTSSGRPNTMTCVYTSVAVDAPTNVPTTGGVVWVVDVHVLDPVTGLLHSAHRQELTNVADAAGITPGPWTDAAGAPTHVVTAGIPVGYSGPVGIAVYNHFFSMDTGQWVGGFWSVDPRTGGLSCALDGGPIVV